MAPGSRHSFTLILIFFTFAQQSTPTSAKEATQSNCALGFDLTQANTDLAIASVERENQVLKDYFYPGKALHSPLMDWIMSETFKYIAYAHNRSLSRVEFPFFREPYSMRSGFSSPDFWTEHLFMPEKVIWTPQSKAESDANAVAEIILTKLFAVFTPEGSLHNLLHAQYLKDWFARTFSDLTDAEFESLSNDLSSLQKDTEKLQKAKKILAALLTEKSSFVMASLARYTFKVEQAEELSSRKPYYLEEFYRLYKTDRRYGMNNERHSYHRHDYKKLGKAVVRLDKVVQKELRELEKTILNRLIIIKRFKAP